MVKNLPANVGDGGDLVLKPGSGRSPGVGNGNPTPVLLPRKFHGQKSLADYNSRGRKSQTQLSTRVSAHTHPHTHTQHLAWRIMVCQVLREGGCGEFLINRHKLSFDQMNDLLYDIAPNNTLYTESFIKRVDLTLSIFSPIIIKE